VFAHISNVPILFHQTALPESIHESLDITTYIMERYPTLAPKSHYGDTMRLLQELHSINYFSLTFSTKPQVAASLEGGVLELLEHGDITDRHREALKYKLEM
jgi:glutathione S-transferase